MNGREGGGSPNGEVSWRDRPAAIAATLAAGLFLGYLTLFELTLHLDKRETTKARGVTVWNTMRQNLPEVRFPLLAELLFLLLGFLTLAGAVALVWLAVEAGGDAEARDPDAQ